MSFTVYYSDPAETTRRGFGKVARIPCIFDSCPKYHRLGSRYLIDRGIGKWAPEKRSVTVRTSTPSEQSIRNYAHWLANFLEWAEIRGLDLTTCTYREHIQSRYQTEMLKGFWSRDGLPLSPRTINARVQQACEFLTWMADKGLRSKFDIAYNSTKLKLGSAYSSVGHLEKTTQSRKGKLRENKRRLRMPTNPEILIWLGEVVNRFGTTKALMCETVLLTAMRREEVSCLRLDTLPEDPREWHISNPDAPLEEQRLLVTIRFGAKGQNYGIQNGDKIGPERTIMLPYTLAAKLHNYRQTLRNKSLRTFISLAKSTKEKRIRIEESVHLFLNEKNGARIKSKDLYNAWTGVKLPFKGWSPHLGRDWWSCSTLWAELKRHESLISEGSQVASALLESTAMSIIRFRIQPQLGHAHDTTSMIYLQWAVDLFGASLPTLYEQNLLEQNSKCDIYK